VLQASGSEAGASERAIFVLNPGGQILLCKRYESNEIPSLDEVFSLLAEV
jgi:hypothetical protein